jgi:transketolase
MNETARDIRKSILTMMHYSKSSHIGGCFSAVEILCALYFDVLNIDPENPRKKDRDIFILSKGHSSAALYATLAHRGFFPMEWLDRYYIDGGLLPGHLDMTAVPGVECSAGSLGHGLSIGLGMAIARTLRREPGRVFVLLGDGECNEGSVWEAAMLAGTRKIGKLTLIVDYNHLQGMGREVINQGMGREVINQGMGREVINQGNLAERFRAFGWKSIDVDGHDINALKSALAAADPGAPTAIVAHTIKGKGVSFMEDRLEWHYKSPNDEQLAAGLAELEKSL